MYNVMFDKMSPIIYFLTCLLYLQASTADKVTFENVPSDITNDIFLYFMQGPTVNDSVQLKLEDGLSLPALTGFDVQRETVFYFHGWGEDPGAHEDSVVTLASAYLQRNFVNLVVFDYSELVRADNQIEYIESFINATYIGTAIGQYFKQYAGTVQPVDLIHLVSHSLGSQIMSKTARTYGSGRLPWLTGLDPAGPLFNIPGVEHLTKDDAVFLDVIHTDGGFYGDYRTIGTVDFFPNKGTRIQPYCLSWNIYQFCSHHMSWRYYAESILNETAFQAKKCYRTPLCDTSLELCTCSIYDGEYTYIGYNVDKNARGTFYLSTNDESPYGQGKEGMDF